MVLNIQNESYDKKVLKYAYEDLNALTFREYTLLNRDAKFINMEYDRRYGYVHLIILPTEDDIDLVDITPAWDKTSFIFELSWSPKI